MFWPRECVVKIRIARPRAFETEAPGLHEVDGLLVDTQKGIVLTVRRATGPGPFSGVMILRNKQEVEVRPIYCDPVHDFGFLQYDPKSVQHVDLVAVDLVSDPPKASTRFEDLCYVIDKKGDLLDSNITHVDSNPPYRTYPHSKVGYKDFRDFNTHYYEARTRSPAGAVGGPLFNRAKQVVALQTGSSPDAFTHYFLPLTYPIHVLRQIQNREEVKRGDIQALFTLKNSCYPHHRGILIMAHSVLPGGSADGKLEVGDILIKINGGTVIDLPSLNMIFDENIGKNVTILVQRSQRHLELDIAVQNLHETTPSSLLMIDDATFHDVSCHDAYRFRHSCQGVSISNTGHCLQPIDRGAIIQRVNYKPTRNTAEFIEVIRRVSAGTRVLTEFWHPIQQRVMYEVVTIDFGWSPSLKVFRRDGMTGKWDVEAHERLPAAVKTTCNVTSRVPSAHGTASTVAEIRSTSLVHVECRPQSTIEGQDANLKSGLGLVIDAQRGFVLVSRAIVLHSFCDIQVTVADSAVLPASVKCLHPWHHWAVICYDANLVRVPVKRAKLSTEDISQGQKITFVGCNGSGEIVEASTSVTKVIAHGLEPLCLCLRTARLINIDRIEVEAALSNECNTGFLIATDATVQGLWIAPESACRNKHRFGINSQEIAAIAEKLSQGVDISFWRLPLELQSVKITDVEAMGVSTEWINKVLAERSDRRMLMVKRTWSQVPHQFQVRDILLSLNGRLVTRPSDVNSTDPEEVCDVVASREGNEITIRASPVPEHDFETTRLATFSGLVVHKPHRTVRHFIDKLPSEIWVASIYPGSPAHWYGVPLRSFIISIDGTPVSCITSLLSVISQIPSNKEFMMVIKDCSGQSREGTLKKDESFFPTTEWRHCPWVPRGWEKVSSDKKRLGHYVERSVKRARPEISQDVDGRPGTQCSPKALERSFDSV
ncbi:hypothetical protein FOC1_g10001239 [Fusarium oxysporum f. sp. cubense race 1]|uniref:PDZ domain-containing protein n=2 Tax=Fusarium oxysporum f. sp. cubense TaxID=61366 RepID=N4TVX0_FUSC1|nr:hypothetical protein FOC1_g10001239 [Fusarium oxysporum f. sp. cubense race 1]